MNLLESVLRTCGAEQFLDVFGDEDIAVENLPLLSEDDLIKLGIEDEQMRKAILTHSRTLTIPTEQLIDVAVDREYVAQVLRNQIEHLNVYNASMTYGSLHKDVENVDIDVHTGCKSLIGVLNELCRQIDELRAYVAAKDCQVVSAPSKRICKPFLVSAAAVLITSMILIKHFT